MYEVAGCSCFFAAVGTNAAEQVVLMNGPSKSSVRGQRDEQSTRRVCSEGWGCCSSVAQEKWRTSQRANKQGSSLVPISSTYRINSHLFISARGDREMMYVLGMRWIHRRSESSFNSCGLRSSPTSRASRHCSCSPRGQRPTLGGGVSLVRSCRCVVPSKCPCLSLRWNGQIPREIDDATSSSQPFFGHHLLSRPLALNPICGTTVAVEGGAVPSCCSSTTSRGVLTYHRPDGYLLALSAPRQRLRFPACNGSHRAGVRGALSVRSPDEGRGSKTSRITVRYDPQLPH